LNGLVSFNRVVSRGYLVITQNNTQRRRRCDDVDDDDYDDDYDHDQRLTVEV